ncbi:MAG: PBSX family phage terminase large subunit [Bacteroidia bacterium]
MLFNDKIFTANTSGRRYIIHQGGTGSGKTYAILQYLLSYAAKHQGKVISVVAETMPHLKRGALRDMRNIIATEGWDDTIKENKSGYYFNINKSTIEFFSADSDSKMRGAKRDLLFINECNNIDYESFEQLDVRTRKRTILDFNPVRRFWVHDKLIPSLQEKDYLFVKSTYLDNPTLTPEEIENIERRRGNTNWWKVYGEGEIGTTDGLIFSNWEIIIDDATEMPGKLLGYGIDFGFTHSPTAIVQVNECEGELLVRELLYKKGLHNDALFDFAKKNLDLRALTVADCNEPKTIDYLYQKGWFGLKPAIKGPDSVEHGINLLQQKKIHVTDKSLNLIKELREYMWDTDLEGKFTNKPVKEYDHAIDALRYVYSYPQFKKTIPFACADISGGGGWSYSLPGMSWRSLG